MIVVLCTSVSKYFCVVNVMCIDHMWCDSSTFASIDWRFHACFGHNLNCGTMALKQPVLVPKVDFGSFMQRTTDGSRLVISDAHIVHRRCTLSVGARPGLQQSTAQKRQNTVDQSFAHLQRVAGQTPVSMPPHSGRVQRNGHPGAPRKERAGKAWGQWGWRVLSGVQQDSVSTR